MDMYAIENAPKTQMQRSHSRGQLVVDAPNGRTQLQRLYQKDALKLRFPKNHIGQDLEGILVNTSGGLAGGDSMSIQVSVQKDADLTLTSQACDRVYKSLGQDAVINLDFTVEDNASLVWAPQETILFNNARLNRKLNVNLEESSRFLAIEAVVWGRELMGETMQEGALQDSWRVHVEGQLIHAENLRLKGDVHAQLQTPVVANGGTATATLLMVEKGCERHLEACREICEAAQGVTGGVSFWQVGPYAKLLIRLVGQTGYDLRKCVVQLVMQLSSNGVTPRVWSM